MVTLTDEQSQEITDKLNEYKIVLSEQLYARYSKEGLQKALNEIEEIMRPLCQTWNEEEE